MASKMLLFPDLKITKTLLGDTDTLFNLRVKIKSFE